MRDGADVVYQATLRSDRWHGRADFLRRVERPSRLGAWSYEVLDAKLARETRAGTILQLCLYSHMLAEIQGVLPERMHVVMPGEDLRPEPFRVQDFLAYHRLVQRRLEAAIGGDGEAPPPTRSRCRNATSAAGGRTAIAGGATTTISASWPGSPSFRSRSCAAAASTRWRRSAGCRCRSTFQPARGALETYVRGARAGPHPARGAARRRAAP